jgi:hypothetical protein
MTITRRTLLRSAVFSACALPGLASAQGSGLRRSRYLQYEEVIFDARRSQALAFAETVRQLGVRARAICRDISAESFQDVCARWHTMRWRAPRTAVAGITDFRSLFLLQTIAADAGMRTVLRIHHHARAETIAHEAFGVKRYRDMADARLAQCGEGWAPQVARLVLGLPEGGLPARGAGTVPPAGNMDAANLGALGSRALVTWVMA